MLKESLGLHYGHYT